MKKRQMEQLVRCSVVRKDESVGKVKGKSKKHKAKWLIPTDIGELVSYGVYIN